MSGPHFDDWKELGAVAPGDALRHARDVLHWAAQVAAAVGATRVPKAPDFRHVALTWSDRHRALVGPLAPGPTPYRAGLRLADATLLVLAEDAAAAELALVGRSFDEALAWLSDATAPLAGPAAAPPLPPEHDMPESDVERALQAGQPFPSLEAAAAVELERGFANADGLLSATLAGEEGAGPVYCWPHHFDIARLVTLDPGAEGEEARSIGAGWSPGDASYDEPYLYVTPWPYPPADDLPALPAPGAWHTDGWVGAVLTSSRLAADADVRAQAGRATEFVRQAYEAARTLLRAT